MKTRYFTSLYGTALATGVCLALTLALAGCASPPNNDHASFRDAGDGFPALDDNWYGGGRFVAPDNVLRLTEGQSKEQVRQLIGDPHFSEGFFRVREWNYVFNLYTGQGNQYITCQYQVRFDDDMALESTRWRDQQCPGLLVKHQETAQPGQRTAWFSGAVLFDFDSETLTLEGQRAVDRILEGIRRDFDDPVIHITAYTDRFGSDAYNDRLSQSRAEVVKRYLMAQGVAESAISTSGKGMANPVVACRGGKATASVTACLRPNRRVEMAVKERNPNRSFSSSSGPT